MRAIAICAVLAGCSAPTPTARPVAGAPAGSGDAGARAGSAGSSGPGPRLADGVVPIAYDLTLELDPDRETFAGHVAITVAVSTPGTTRLWLHAVDLEITSAALRAGDREQAVAVLDGDAASQMRGFVLPQPVGGAGAQSTITLVIDYTGHVSDLSGRTGKDEAGLFRERAGGRWYLYSQAESVFARTIVPCFDEPRFKPAWRVTAVVPPGQVALGNAAMRAEHALADGRREVRFAELAAMPSYLLAVAVGPFELVDAGALGRAHVPARLAVANGDGKHLARALRELPRIVSALEGYLDRPLPLAKLDLVAVPRFFGAMENPGLITVETAVLVGERELVAVIAHELAHQWFGNSVTPAWWDQLWLSEAFATWLGDRVTASLEGAPAPERVHGARAQAFAADDAIDAAPLVHRIATSDEVEPAFDAIAYEKGAAVLAMFEAFTGEPAFRAAARGYVAAHAGTSVTSQAFIAALAAATSPAVAAALADNLAHAGTPVVELAVRCGAAPAIVAVARDGVTIPVCVRFPAAPAAAARTRTCVIAGPHTEQALPAAAGCPAWLVGNDGSHGYYRTVWRDPARRAPLAELSREERLGRGDDAAGAFRNGELPIADALAELAALAATRDPYGELAALAIARAIDPLVDEPVRPAWLRWLADRFARDLTRAALTAPGTAVERVLRGELVELVGDAVDPAARAAARDAIDHHPGGDRDDAELRLAAAARDGGELFDRIVAAAATATSDELRDDLLEELGAFPATYAPRIVDVLLDARFAAVRVWPALAAMLERGGDRATAWRAIHARLPEVLAALPAAQVRAVIAATAVLCDAPTRAELAAAFTPRLAAIHGGSPALARAVDRALGHALATIDRCIARRAATGDIAGALTVARPSQRASAPHR